MNKACFEELRLWRPMPKNSDNQGEAPKIAVRQNQDVTHRS